MVSWVHLLAGKSSGGAHRELSWLSHRTVALSCLDSGGRRTMEIGTSTRWRRRQVRQSRIASGDGWETGAEVHGGGRDSPSSPVGIERHSSRSTLRELGRGQLPAGIDVTAFRLHLPCKDGSDVTPHSGRWWTTRPTILAVRRAPIPSPPRAHMVQPPKPSPFPSLDLISALIEMTTSFLAGDMATSTAPPRRRRRRGRG